MTGGVKLEICFEEDAEFCKRFMNASYSERVVMLAHVMEKQADGTWLELSLGRPSVKFYERTSTRYPNPPATVASGVSSEDFNNEASSCIL